MIEHNFKKKFGQNFLTDTNLLSAIVSDAGITKEDQVLEIGAGAGALTTELAKRAKKVVSFEIDTDLISHLNSLGLANTEFVFEDALKKDIKEIEGYFDDNYKLVANLPYYITTPLIFKFLENSTKLTSLTIMVQKEVAERIVANCGGKDYGILTVMINFFGFAKITRIVNRKLFYPEPNVDSALVRIDLQKNKFPNVDRQKFSSLIKGAFSMRRKTLLNNLSSALSISKENLQKSLPHFDLSKRAETLNIDDFIQLYDVIYINSKK